jgi:hypothetical protein
MRSGELALWRIFGGVRIFSGFSRGFNVTGEQRGFASLLKRPSVRKCHITMIEDFATAHSCIYSEFGRLILSLCLFGSPKSTMHMVPSRVP